MLQLRKREPTDIFLSSVRPGAESRVFATLTLAFANYPPNRWVYPESADHLKFFPPFARAWRRRDSKRTAFANGAFTAVALWLGPDAGPDEEAIGRLIGESVSVEKQADLAGVIEQMVRFHPENPHWYLPFVGVDAACQNRGLGTAILRPMLARCDAERLPAYLESTNPRNRPFYERLGFRALGKIAVGGCPPIVPMMRRPG